MGRFIVEVYELHAQKYVVDDDDVTTAEEAVERVQGGEGDCMDSRTGLEYIEVADRYHGEGLPDGIRSVEED